MIAIVRGQITGLRVIRRPISREDRVGNLPDVLQLETPERVVGQCSNRLILSERIRYPDRQVDRAMRLVVHEIGKRIGPGH